MFSGIGFSEILIVLLVALLVLGPDKLPDAARKLGKGLREVRRASNMFRDMFLLEDEQEQSGRAGQQSAQLSSRDDSVAGTLAANIGQGRQKGARSRPVLLNEPRRPTHIRSVTLGAPKLSVTARHFAESAESADKVESSDPAAPARAMKAEVMEADKLPEPGSQPGAFRYEALPAARGIKI